MVIVPRETVWPGQVPHNTTGSVRPLLAPLRPLLAIHYTGGGLWLDPDDTPAELRSIQSYAAAAGKPWEYNYVIDGQGVVWEYAGRYRAAHAGEPNNSNAYAILLLVGLADTAHLTGFETVTEAMIVAVRRLRQWLVDVGALAAGHEMLQDRQLPGRRTICPGPEVVARWDDLTRNLKEDDMTTATLWKDCRYTAVFLVGSGPALNVSGEMNQHYLALGVPFVEDTHDGMLDTCLYQTGKTRAWLVAA